ncbi:MAG: hypothetical protein P8Y77_10755 [Nitrospirota bacterium]|jgi:hypothetical protein
MRKHDEEPMELGHEPVPGYRTAFYIVLAAAVLYLGATFLFGWR